MKVMVTGPRTWGACTEEIPLHRTLLGRRKCPQWRAAYAVMIGALADVGIGVGEAQLPGIYHELIHGDAEGADRMMAGIWRTYGLGPITAFPYVKELGGYGGHARNDVLVAHMPDRVLAFHPNHSPGTADAIARARKAGLDVHVYPKEK